MFVVEIENSSLVKRVIYDDDNEDLTVVFKKYYTDELTYEHVSEDWFQELIQSKSVGRCYLQLIKPHCKLKQTQKMPDKVIKCKINVRDLNKDWFFEGEKGVYANFTILFNEKPDAYGNNGMIVQDVPTEIYKAEKDLPNNEKSKGAILGNCKVFANAGGASAENQPGKEGGTLTKGKSDVLDDLPF